MESMKTKPTVAMIGTGIVGKSWSIVFSRAGFRVNLYGKTRQHAERLVSEIKNDLQMLEGYNLLNGRSVSSCLSSLVICDTMEQALAPGVIYAQENLPENLEMKKRIYAQMDSIASRETILASSTSGICASAFTEPLTGRDRCLVAHPVNPPHLIPVVEIVPSPWTQPGIVQRTKEILLMAGQAPVVLRKEVKGFLVNRLQGALLQEAFKLVDDGVASAEDVDITMKDGLGLRWSFMGPFETIDLNAPGGVKDYVTRYGEGMYNLAVDMGPPRKWGASVTETVTLERRGKIHVDDLKERCRWRDINLMRLIAHKATTLNSISDSGSNSSNSSSPVKKRSKL